MSRFKVGNLQLQWQPRESRIEPYAFFLKSLCGRSRDRTYVFAPKIHSNSSRYRCPSRTFVGSYKVEYLFREATSIVVSRAKKEYHFHGNAF